MKLENFIFPISAALFALSMPASSDGGTIDYTLGLTHRAPVRNQILDIDNEQLYRLGDVTSIATINTFDQFQLIEPQTGISYSTRFRFDHSADGEMVQNDISPVSRLYKIGYGGQRYQWYSGVNLSVEKFESAHERQEGDLWTLDFTAGRRIALTGLGAGAPLWMLSLNGEYDQYRFKDASLGGWTEHGIWYITPAVHWTAEDFSLSAGVQMPLDLNGDAAEEEPNYHLRANFKQRF